MNVVFCVYRRWNLAILEGLIAVQAPKAWKVTFVVAPTGMEIPHWPDVRMTHVDPARLEETAQAIAAERPGVILCYGWSWMIPPRIRDIAPCLVLHPSPLPRYRGGSPIQNQVLDGVRESAVSIFIASDRVDAGAILAQERISFEGYLQDIVDRMSEVGLRLTIDMLDRMAQSPIAGVAQDESAATECTRRKPAMSEITIEELKTRSAEYIYNKIRCLQDPYPEAFIVCGDGKKVYLTAAHLEHNADPV